MWFNSLFVSSSVPLAQWKARWTSNPKVLGSTPRWDENLLHSIIERLRVNGYISFSSRSNFDPRLLHPDVQPPLDLRDAGERPRHDGGRRLLPRSGDGEGRGRQLAGGVGRRLGGRVHDARRVGGCLLGEEEARIY